MNCTCKNCQGTGEVPCFECHGDGYYEITIENATLDKDMPHYQELLDLQADARAARTATARLKELNFFAVESYEAQFKTTLASINRQADALSLTHDT